MSFDTKEFEEFVKLGGSAFPFNIRLSDGSSFNSTGLSARDWFAGRFMQAMAPAMMDAARQDGAQPGEVALVLASAAYLMADAMIAARKERGS